MILISRFAFLIIFILWGRLLFAQPPGSPQGRQMRKANTEGIQYKFLDIVYASKSPARKVVVMPAVMFGCTVVTLGLLLVLSRFTASLERLKVHYQN